MDSNALAQELKDTVERIRDIQAKLDDVVLALKENQEEVDLYTDEIADCCDRIEAIDEFVHEIQAGNVPAMNDVTSVMSNMAGEREEEENMLKLLGEACTCHEEQLEYLKMQFSKLQEERLVLQKKNSQNMCALGRARVFELVTRLAERSIKMF